MQPYCLEEKQCVLEVTKMVLATSEEFLETSDQLLPSQMTQLVTIKHSKFGEADLTNLLNRSQNSGVLLN